MFGEIPKILDRNFLIGYFLPAIAALSVSLGLIHSYQLLDAPRTVGGGALCILFPTAGGVILLEFNRTITQWIEGYIPLIPQVRFDIHSQVGL